MASQAPPAEAGRQESVHDRKSQVLKQHTASVVRSIADAVVVREGEPFFVTPPDGQIPVGGGHGFGLYDHDTRFLSGYELQVAGATPNPLAATSLVGGRAILELTMPTIQLPDGRTIAKERLTLRWERTLEDEPARLRDRLTFRNFDDTGARLPLRFAFAADFDDVFAVRGLLDKVPGTRHDPRWDGDHLVFRYDGADGVVRTVTVEVDADIGTRDGSAFEVDVDVAGRGDARLDITLSIGEELQPGAKPIERRVRESEQHRTPRPPRSQRGGEGGTAATQGWPLSVQTDGIAFDAALSRSLDDLLTLRGELDGQRYYSAGIPWFATLFGRDALITAHQTLAFDRDVAAETLRLLAARQGTKVDDWRDEEPGKILHELRIGELARLGEIPHTPYYGSIDATPLFLILLGRHARWTGSLDLFHELRGNVDRALGWLDRAVAADPRGFVAYDSTTDRGLVNQGWKDSGDAIVTADGRIASPPIALAEVQGYAFAAWRSIADLYELDGDDGTAARLRSAAEDLRARFEAAFWSDRLGCYVLALEEGGQPCDVVTSNAGQVLWSGIASPDRADLVTARLVQPDMFNGWGIRTLSASAAAFNPIGYHLGTVWPHDNGLIVEGLRRYGRDAEAEQLLVALVEATTDFPEQRLPECFAGYARDEFRMPVRYPVACHPQAWAAGAVPHMLLSVLGVVPEAFEHRLRVVRPRLPPSLERIRLRGLRIGDASVDLTFLRDGHRTAVHVDDVAGELHVDVTGTDADA